jgi:DNA polymerase
MQRDSSTLKALEQTIRHSFGEILDFPIFETSSPSTSPAGALAEYAKEIRFCEKCSFHIGRSNLVFGRGHWGARIAFIGDVPSDTDDRKGEPFNDENGELLNKMILAMKIRPEEAYLTNIFKCRPPTGERPDGKFVQGCETHLKFQFSQIGARVIVALGDTAARALCRSESPLQVLRKQVFEWEGRKIIPTHHPRDLHNWPNLKKEAWEDLQSAIRELGRLT